MLAEESPVYAGLGTNQAERLRGYVLASFEEIGLPPDVIPFVLEQLETGRNPYTVAAAGRALRGAEEFPFEASGLIVAAIRRLRWRDEYVSFKRLAPALRTDDEVTSLADLAATLTLLGPRAASARDALETLLITDAASFSPTVRTALSTALDALAASGEPERASCCDGGRHEPGPICIDVVPPSKDVAELRDIELENQYGGRLRFGEAFFGRPTALAFFYTRCMNPEKCSLTVTRLARLGSALTEARVDANVAGISYDPRFDNHTRLRAYGEDRGMVFSARCSLLRTVGPFDPLQAAFALGVGFGPVTVNQHRLDLVVLDHSLGVAATFERRLWDEDIVLGALRAAQR